MGKRLITNKEVNRLKKVLIILLIFVMSSVTVYGYIITEEEIDYINDIRTNIRLSEKEKLPIVHSSIELTQAALDHSLYLEEYNLFTHQQDRNKEMFSGIYPWDRATYYGYKNIYIDELIVQSTNSIKNDIMRLIDNPYYRIDLLNPTYTDIGMAKTDDKLVVQLGGTKNKQEYRVAFPFNNQKNVPRIWAPTKLESDPFRIYDVKAPYGYPITYTVYSPIKIKKIEVVKNTASLINKTNTINEKILINTPNTDNYLSNSVIILPLKPLDSNTEYEVKFTLQITFANNETKIDPIKWSFKTGNYATMSNIAEQDRMTRQQFAELIVDEYNLPVPTTIKNTYVDVKSNSTYAKYIYTLKELGIMSGYSDTTFGYDEYLTREQAFVIIMRLYNYLTGDDYRAMTIENYPQFVDMYRCSSWAKAAVNAAYDKEIIHGKPDNVLDPKAFINYGESKQIIKNLSNVLNTLP